MSFTRPVVLEMGLTIYLLFDNWSVVLTDPAFYLSTSLIDTFRFDRRKHRKKST